MRTAMSVHSVQNELNDWTKPGSSRTPEVPARTQRGRAVSPGRRALRLTNCLTMSSGNPALTLDDIFLAPGALPSPPLRRNLFLFLLALAFLLHVATAGWGPLYNETDGQYAGGAREMLESHQWFFPTNDGVPRLQKPPLVYWTIMLSLKAFGLTTAAGRLPTALATVAAVALTFLIGDRLGGPWLGYRRRFGRHGRFYRGRPQSRSGHPNLGAIALGYRTG